MICTEAETPPFILAALQTCVKFMLYECPGRYKNTANKQNNRNIIHNKSAPGWGAWILTTYETADFTETDINI